MTNGFDHIKVIGALSGRLAFRQPTQAAYAILDAANSTSKSLRYFDDFHPLVSVDNIKDIICDAAITNLQFNSYLTSLQQSVVMRSVNCVYTTPEAIDEVVLFDREGKNDRIATNTGRFVGYKIKCTESVYINRVRLYFDGAADFPIYLFHDGHKTRIKQQSVSSVANEITEVTLTDFYLDGNKGGHYFIGYFQDDLGEVSAIHEQVSQWSTPYCIGIEQFGAVATEAADFDRNNDTNPDGTSGLNLELISFRDKTQTIIRNASLFDELIGLQMAYVIIESIMHSDRSNAKERGAKISIDKTKLLMDLKGGLPISDGPSVMSFDKRIAAEIKRIRGSFDARPRGVVYPC